MGACIECGKKKAVYCADCVDDIKLGYRDYVIGNYNNRFGSRNMTETEQWDDVMSKAREYGFLIKAAGGTAVLVTRENQLKHYGREEYERIQKMNGREAD